MMDLNKMKHESHTGLQKKEDSRYWSFVLEDWLWAKMVKDRNVGLEALTKKHGKKIMKESLKKDQQKVVSNPIRFQKNNTLDELKDFISSIV